MDFVPLLVIIDIIATVIFCVKTRPSIGGAIGFAFIFWFIGPFYLMGVFFILAFTLGIGSVFGLPVGIFYGVKNYMQSIRDNISNKTFKILMIVITWLIIIIFIFYLFAVTYFLYGYFN